ncbi:hypothetical protein BTO05_08305 [Winogradskyella sp. PC-19]|uniref:hypothetical protein n=1 Tax=unclassified Winogradskyella TaxID=2615021 RepID=UPI000B3D3106|nr:MULTISPECIES: hypothetical protein [unclassified Winogradskyella]ARV09642.1 hypothetical protein BTO05_08305 [Winogradskyella sp. PC-19]RZN83318.1 MAG: hypothetical protein EVB12_01795 [Winogradskyella sp.]
MIRFLLKAQTFCFLAICFFHSNLTAQNNNYEVYHKSLNKAKSFKSLDSTVFYFKKAFKAADPFSKDLKSLAFYYYKNNDLKNADFYFLKSIAYGYQFEDDKNFKKLPYKVNYQNGFLFKYENSESPYANFIKTMATRNEKEMRKSRKKFLSTVDLVQDETYEVLLQNEYYFQQVRLKILPKKDINQTEYKTVAKYLGSGNSYMMLDLLKTNKFPNRRYVSRFSDQSINMLLNHAVAAFINKDDAKEFIDLLWSEVERGNITPYDYAKAYDHYVNWYIDNESTYYGTTLYMPEGYDNMVYMNVLFPKKLNELRNDIWLISIEEISSKTGFHLPLNYKK